MKLLLVTCKEDDRAKFYFKSIEDFEAFEYVFKDHWCHIHFTCQGIEDVNDKYYIDEANKDPKERANNNLSWGFANADNTNTPEEEAFIRSFMSRIQS